MTDDRRAVPAETAPHCARSAAAAPGSAGRALPVVLGLLVTIAVVLAAVLGGDGDGDREGGQSGALAAGAAADRATDLPGPDLDGREALQATTNGFAGAAAPIPLGELLAALDYPRSELAGRLILEGGGVLPAGLQIHATQRQPYPQVRRMGQAMDAAGEWNDAEEALVPEPDDAAVLAEVPPPGGDVLDATRPAAQEAVRTRFEMWRDLPAVTRTAVAADGSFRLPNFPERGAWLELETELLYQVDARRHDGEEEEVRVLVAYGARIEGRVVDPSGAVVPRAEVEAHTPVDPYAVFDSGVMRIELEDGAADEQGRFVLAPVPVGMELRVSASDPRETLVSVGASVAPLAAGQVHAVELRLKAGAVLAGVVLDEREAPVPSAEVHIQPAALDMAALDELGSLPRSQVECDAEGRFHFGSLPPGEFVVLLASAGHRIARSEPIRLAEGERRDDLVLHALAGLTVAGQVVDHAGQPVTTAWVKVAVPPSFISMRANTERELRDRVQVDAEGRFRVAGHEEGEVRVSASAPGFMGAHEDVPAGADDVLVQLQPLGSLSGIAASLIDGEPVPHYTLRVTPEGGLFSMAAMFEMEQRMEQRVPLQDVRDPSGRFEVTGVAPGTYDLRATADGFAQATALGVEVLAGQATRGIVLTLPEEARVLGTVVSARDGRPVAGAEIGTGRSDAMSAWTSMLDGGSSKAHTDDDGRFELGGLGHEPVVLGVSHAGHQPVTLESMVLKSGQVLDLGLITLPRGATIWGRVSDERGRPTAGVSVLVAEVTGRAMKRGRSDADGAYRVEGLAPGTYNVMRMDFQMSLTRDNPASFLEDMNFEPVALAADEERRVDLQKGVRDGTRLTGQVRSVAGPEPQAMLAIVRETDETGMRFGSTDADGRYTIAGLKPGRWLLSVFPSSDAMQAGSQPAAGASFPVTIGAGPVQSFDVTLPGGALLGLVVAEDGGAPIAGARVLLERSDEGRPASAYLEAVGWRAGETFSGPDGGFAFRHLPAGSYAVVAGGQNIMGLGEAGWAARRVSDIAVADGPAGLTVKVELRPGGAISGVVRDRQGQPLAGIPVWARDDRLGRWQANLSEIVTDGGGSYTVNSLEPGPWTLAFGGDSHALTLVSGVTVSRDRVATQDARLEPGVEIWVDCGPFDPFELRAWVSGPQGPLPTQLSSLERLMSSRIQGQRMRVGRVLPGSYQLSVQRGGEEVHGDTLKISGGEPSLTIVLGEEG